MRKYAAYLTATAVIIGITFGTGPVSLTAKADTSTQESAIPSALGELFKYEIRIGADVIKLPVSFQELKAKGWVMTDGSLRDDDMVSDSVHPTFSKGNMSFSGTMWNEQDQDVPLNQLNLSTIIVTRDMMGGQELVLPGNIVLGRSGSEDVKAAYGYTEASVRDGGGYYSLSYAQNAFQSVTFSYGGSLIDEIYFYNLADCAKELMDGLNNYEPTPSALAYQAPTQPGTDLSSFIFEFDGDHYQLPAPLSAFEQNGWKIELDYLTSSNLKAGERTSIYISRNGKREMIYVWNYEKDTTSLHNCTVSTIWEVVLPGGLQTGSTTADVLRVLRGTPYTVEGGRYGNKTYTVSNESKTAEISIIVDQETGVVVTTKAVTN